MYIIEILVIDLRNSSLKLVTVSQQFVQYIVQFVKKVSPYWMTETKYELVQVSCLHKCTNMPSWIQRHTVATLHVAISCMPDIFISADHTVQIGPFIPPAISESCSMETIEGLSCKTLHVAETRFPILTLSRLQPPDSVCWCNPVNLDL